ncbi:MAG TPA: RNA polymerase subunit sigma-24 [Clostridiaceae bacterium]|nr:RNA polymerase subunit sigma-24 [Clostridiaceae bacterium]
MHCEVRILNYPEKELVRKSRNGDIEAFESLIQSYEKRIFNIAYRMTGDREDAYDISQEVCIKIYKFIKKFRGDSSFGTWVYRITSNVCIDELRKRKANVIPFTITNPEGEYEIPVADRDKLPDEAYESKELSEAIRLCLLQLEPKYRVMIVLKDIYGYKYEEISKILNINMGTVKSRINRARKLLKDELEAGNLLGTNPSKK